MKTFTTDGRVPLAVILPDPDPDNDPDRGDDENAPAPSSPHPADIETADQDEVLAAYTQPRTVTFPGREPLDLEAISDLWLD